MLRFETDGPAALRVNRSRVQDGQGASFEIRHCFYGKGRRDLVHAPEERLLCPRAGRLQPYLRSSRTLRDFAKERAEANIVSVRVARTCVVN